MRIQIIVEDEDEVVGVGVNLKTGDLTGEEIPVPPGTYEVTGSMLGEYDDETGTGIVLSHVLKVGGKAIVVQINDFADKDPEEDF